MVNVVKTMTNRELRLHIRYLGEGRKLPVDTECGLCKEMWTFTPLCSGTRKSKLKARNQSETILELMRIWPKRLNSVSYTVPHPTMSGRTAYQSIKNKWNPEKRRISAATQEYVNNRLSLCRWIARQLYKLPEWR